ncbi:MAG: hypothetical protein JWP01_799 [Myxococcales bacterium]|nr:hypothetical protein [Myxococcales bacterium]
MHKLTMTTMCVLLAGCPEKEDYTKQKPEEVAATTRDNAPPPPQRPKKNPPPADLGSCNLSVTGGITAEQTTPGGKEATNVAYWFLPEERKNMMGVDGYVVNCKGDKFRFSLLPGGGKLDGMPFGPKKFTFVKGKSDGANVMMAFGQATLADPNGTVEITALDNRHIAGTIDLAGKVVPGNKPIKVTGKFDLVCPGFSACDFGDAPQ